MNNPKILQVLLDGTLVGTLAVNAQRLVAFSYDEDWLQNGFSISPLSLPLQGGVFLPKKYDPFDGLFGVFADSLPDGWGRLLVDRLLKSKGLRPVEVNSLQRLSIVGSTGMGALTYETEPIPAGTICLPWQNRYSFLLRKQQRLWMRSRKL